MNAKNIELTPGTALVLAGCSGSGKTTLAAEIASRYGDYTVTVFPPWADLANLPLGPDSPKTVIVEGLPTASDLEAFKPFIANTGIAVKSPLHANPISRVAPNFIFCTGDSNAGRTLSGSRRFRVVEIGGVKQPPKRKQI